MKRIATAKIDEVEEMLEIPAYGAASAKAPLAPFFIERRKPGPHDLLVEILYCGICHSDIHQARGEWGASIFPMVPGHEIVGIVTKAGDKVEKWKRGDTVGIGCFVDSCRGCEACKAGEEQFCERDMSQTYNSYERDGRTPTYGGYSTRITVDENYVLRIPKNIPLDARHRCRARALIGGIRETQEMLDFCAKHGVASNVEVIPIQQINEAYERMMKCDVRYRFVIDIASLKRPQAMPRWDQERYNVSANSNHAYW